MSNESFFDKVKDFVKGHPEQADQGLDKAGEFLDERDRLFSNNLAGWIDTLGPGGRSALAVSRLQEMGFSNVVHMAGGIKAWKDANGAIEKVN